MRRAIILVVVITLFSELTSTVRAQSLGQVTRVDPIFLAELNAFRTRISQCLTPPQGIDASSTLRVTLRVLFEPDGTLTRDPRVDAIEGEPIALGPSFAESAKKAFVQCQPFTMLKPEHYDRWKDLEVNFDAHGLLSGRAQ
jgi:hypothetical protein